MTIEAVKSNQLRELGAVKSELNQNAAVLSATEQEVRGIRFFTVLIYVLCYGLFRLLLQRRS